MSLSLVAPALAGVLVAGAGGLAMTSDVELLEDRAFRVLTPRDGARVAHGFPLTWTGRADGRYAVVVDAAVPAPDAVVPAGDHVVTVTGTSVLLTLGDRRKGSPSARDHHVVAVVPLDASGRRSGEAVAVVHVRA